MKDMRAGKLQMIQIRGCETPPNIHTFKKKKKIVTKISPVLESSLMLPVSLIKFPVFWLGAAKTGLPAEACHLSCACNSMVTGSSFILMSGEFLPLSLGTPEQIPDNS